MKPKAPLFLFPTTDTLDTYINFQRYHLSRYAEIGMALSGGENIPRLLEMIVHEARDITNADAGTLYMVNDERTHLIFVIMQNETMNAFLGGLEGDEITMPPVPLFIQERENHANVSSHVALTGEIVNIPDVYESKDFDFSGTRAYDATTGYRSRSMLVIPMRNHEKDVIGVLQLLNARHEETSAVTVFNDEYVTLVAALASQAAVTLTKTRLILDLENLFDAFIRSIAGAIEEKSHYTGGHIARVSKLATMIAEEINQTEQGAFRETHFSSAEIEEIRLAAWLHDIGKIITPKYLIDKSKKLETIYDRAHLVATRFQLIAKCMENAWLRETLAQSRAEENNAPPPDAGQDLQNRLARLEEEKQFILTCNAPEKRLTQTDIERIKAIGAKTFVCDGEERPYLEKDEVHNLVVPKGSLTQEERRIIENHAGVTYRMLKKLPFPKHLKRVPEFAAHHHEKLDGTGYPFGLTKDELSLQARIMAVADIFEALTAPDRPYKEPMPLSQAMSILGSMRDAGQIDSDVHDLLINSQLLLHYAREELRPNQVDISLKDVQNIYSGDVLARNVERLLLAPPRPCAPRPRPVVLVVDDSESTRMLLHYFLKTTPYLMEFACSGLEGLTKLVKCRPDLVLVDLELLPMDGYEFVHRIREWEQRHGLPRRNVVAMAAPYLLHHASRINEAGFTQTINRPFGKKQFLEFLAPLLENAAHSTTC